MQISLRSTGKKLLFSFCVILAIAQFCYLSSRAARAHAWSEGVQRWQVERAVTLEPHNADYWFRLGHWHELIDQDNVAAMSDYNAAAQQNPHIAAYYIDIARLDLFADDRAQIALALEKALAVDPTTPSVNWKAANLYLASNQTDRALPLFRTTSASSWEYRATAARLSWQATHDVDRMVAAALPSDAAVYTDFLHYLVLNHENTAADRMWTQLVELRQPIQANSSFFYLDSLLKQHRVSDAVRSWQELPAVSQDAHLYQLKDGNLVVNPGFEQTILNGGFDWRITPLDKVAVEVISGDSSNGSKSLSITFDTTQTGGTGVSQVIPVEPDSNYLLSIAYKTENLEGAHGISASVTDIFTGQPVASSEEMLGSTQRRELSKTFRTGPSTVLISLEFTHPSGTLIRGKLLIDDVRLVKQ